MADDIRIKDLQSTASYMESDDYLGIDSLASGTRKINFAGLMDSEDDRLPTTDKTLRGAITEHEGDISEIKQSLSDLSTPTAVSTGVTGLGAIKCGKIILLTSFNTSPVTAAANETIWTLPRALAPLTYSVQIDNVYGNTRLILDVDGTIKTTTAIDTFVRFTVMYIVQ